MSLLSNLYSGFNLGSIGNNNVKWSPLTMGTNFSGFSFSPKVQTLPNGGGTINTVAPTPANPVVSANQAAAVPQVPPQYINNDGSILTPTQVATNVAKTLPGYDIPQFAGDTLTQGPQTTEQLTSTVAGLNNTRNDIATGQTDPYKAASGSGVAYSPDELKAIESAYAGIYDPAINTALAKLDAKQKADTQKLEDESWAAKQIFTTNENIRQWRATTGTKSSGDGVTEFTSTQENKGASKAGMDIATFQTLDADIKNHFINMPEGTDPVTEKAVPIKDIFSYYMTQVKNGKMTNAEVAELIASAKELPEAVRTYYIDRIPMDATEKDGLFSKIWGGVKSVVGGLVQ